MSDGLNLAVGIMLTVVSLGAIFRPDMLVKHSRSRRDARLREIEAGAPEWHFEERRELEAYPPRFDFSDRALRVFGVVGITLGLGMILLSL